MLTLERVNNRGGFVIKEVTENTLGMIAATNANNTNASAESTTQKLRYRSSAVKTRDSSVSSIVLYIFPPDNTVNYKRYKLLLIVFEIIAFSSLSERKSRYHLRLCCEEIPSRKGSKDSVRGTCGTR